MGRRLIGGGKKGTFKIRWSGKSYWKRWYLIRVTGEGVNHGLAVWGRSSPGGEVSKCRGLERTVSPAGAQCDRSRVSKRKRSQAQLMYWEGVGFHKDGEVPQSLAF